MKVAVLTGGGDAPGLNAAIRAVARAGWGAGYDVIGVRNGWQGLVDTNLVPLTLETTSGILPRGGTILGTSRFNPFKVDGGPDRMLDTIHRHDIDAIVAIGGDDTLGVALKLSKLGVNVVGIPKTMDNDIPGTDFTIGFDTAVNVVMEACDRLHPTAEAHHRVMVVEVMGRDAGWVAAVGGLAGGADIILVHEARVDAFGHVRLGGVGNVLAREIEARTGYECRVTVLGHLQRGGAPTVFDRVLATRYGGAAGGLLTPGQVGRMVALRGNTITAVPLQDALEGTHAVSRELYEMVNLFT